jgi:uncharacterized protein involved in exopolysaccharide biosynthesis/Mrp family chromosome partitioning ATPase
MSLQRLQSAPMQQFAPGAPPPAEGPVSPAREDQPFFRLDLLRSLQMHRGLALSFALIGIGMAVASVARSWPVYFAQSQVYIQPALPKVMEQAGGARWAADPITYDSFIQQQVQSATHPDVLLSVLHKLGPDRWQGQNETETAAAERLGRSMDVSRVESSYQISITAHAKDGALSADIANAMAASIVERASREEKAGDSERLEILRQEKDRIQKELESDRTEQESLNAKLGVAAIGAATPDHYDDDIGRLHEELVKARSEHDQAATRLLSMDGEHELSAKALAAESDELIASDPGLISMKTSLNQRRAALITQMANLTPNHPQYKQAAQELAQIDASLEGMTKDLRAKAATRIKQRLSTDLVRTAGMEGRLNAQLGKLAGAAASATPKLQRANDLATDIQRLQTRQSSVEEQLHNLMLEDSTPGAAHLSVTAVTPQHPTNSGLLRKALPMALGGILFGILAALLASNLDTKIYVAADFVHVLGFAPMALLPDFKEVSTGVQEEHLLRLAATIEHAHQLGNLKSCIFTSTGPGTGVTTVSAKVKTILEAMGKPCVLVDASGMLPPQGADFTVKGSHDKQALVASPRGGRSTALLQQLSEEAEGEESLVLTDAAPLPISAETEYLARYVDAAIVVVESGVTTRAQLREAADTLQRLNVGSVGFVLNRIGLKKADPAFRNSVRAIEKHLRSQSRSLARQTERTQAGPAMPALPKAQKVARKEAAPAASEPNTAPIPATAAKAAALPTAHSVPELSAASPIFTPLPQRVTRVARVEKFEQPDALPVSSLRSRQFVPPRQEQPKAEAPHIQETQIQERAIPETRIPDPRIQEPRIPETRIPEPRQPELASEPQAAVASPQFAADARLEPTPQIHETLSDRLSNLEPEPAYVDANETAETPYIPAYKIGGLRGLAFSLGKMHPPATPEAPQQVADLWSPVYPVHERPLYEHSYAAVPPPPVPTEKPSISPAHVTAQPEILPPTPPEEEEPRASKKSAPRDQRDEDDDMDILPSWHGQYKKR